MAAKKPAIQTRQGHAQGLGDDVAKFLLSGAKKVIGKSGAKPRRVIKSQIRTQKRINAFNVIKANEPWYGMSEAQIAATVAKSKPRVSRKEISAVRARQKKK